MAATAQHWINHLDLQPHPEGGYYKELYRSDHVVLRENSEDTRTAITSIYYLLESGDFSAFHRLKSDELWYFHQGDPLHIHVITEDGTLKTIELGDMETGSLQAIIPPNLWFAAEVAGNGYSLVSCVVAPGFEFSEFEMAKKQVLIAQLPQHRTILERLCRI